MFKRSVDNSICVFFYFTLKTIAAHLHRYSLSPVVINYHFELVDLIEKL